MSILIKFPNESLLEQMRTKEEQIRQSQEYRSRCDAVCDVPNGWLQVTGDIQKELCREFGFTDQISLDYTLERLRTAHLLYPNNPVFQNSLQVKNNKANYGTLRVGQTAPNMEMYNLNRNLVNLTDLTLSDNKTIIFAGSHT